MQRDELLPPPRWNDHGAVCRHLTNGGSLEHVPWGNDYLPYIKQLMEKKLKAKCECNPFAFCCKTYRKRGLFWTCLKEYGHSGKCGKPHNNGEDKDAEYEAWKAERDYNL